MRVSTVIPVYNRPVLVERAIVASLEQGYEDHEVVVIDNCSTDGTWEVLQRWANRDERIKCFRNERNLGPVRNWKRGVELATGELCHLLFSDDSVEPDFLRLTVPQLDPETAFVMVGHTKWTDSGPVGNSSFQREPEIPRDKFLDAGIFWNPNQIQMINTVSALFRRSDLRTAIIDDIPNPLGLVHADHGAGPDILIFMLIASRYRRVRCVNQLLARMYSHDGSITVQSKDLRIPREWVRWYFVREYWPEKIREYQAALWLQSLKNPSLNSVYAQVAKETGRRASMSFAMKYGIRRTWNRRFSRNAIHGNGVEFA